MCGDVTYTTLSKTTVSANQEITQSEIECNMRIELQRNSTKQIPNRINNNRYPKMMNIIDAKRSQYDM